MSPATFFFLLGFVVIASVSLVPAVQQERAARRHARRRLERQGRRPALTTREPAP